MSVNAFADLDREWIDLLETNAFRMELTAMAAQYPGLAILDGGTQGPRWHPRDADAALHALLAERAHGSYSAGRTVLQCMMPSMRTIARRSRWHYEDASEVQAETVAAMWLAIVTYNLDRRSGVATWLHGMTWTHVAGDRAPYATGRRVSRGGLLSEVPMSPEALMQIAGEQDAGGSSHALGVTGEALEWIMYGCDAGVLSTAEATLLVQFYVPAIATHGPGRGRHQAEVARRLGLTPNVARQRARRAVLRLAEVIREHRASV